MAQVARWPVDADAAEDAAVAERVIRRLEIEALVPDRSQLRQMPLYRLSDEAEAREERFRELRESATLSEKIAAFKRLRGAR